MKAIEKIKAGNIDLSEDEIIELLRINNFSSEYYDLLAASNALSRRKFGKDCVRFPLSFVKCHRKFPCRYDWDMIPRRHWALIGLPVAWVGPSFFRVGSCW